jgi:hypothetical protein
MAKMVDFSSMEDIIEAYEKQDIPVFAIFHDKQLKFKYTDDDIDGGVQYLEQLLARLNKPSNYAIYTMQLYQDSDGKITNKTGYDASFNFQLNESKAGAVAKMSGIQRGDKDYTDLAVENAELKMKIAKLEEQLEGGGEVDGVLGTINGLMENEGVAAVIGSLGGKIAEMIDSIGKPKNVAGVSRISGIENLADFQRIEGAVQELALIVKDLPDLLEKLVAISKSSPTKFKMFMGGLRSMKV